MIAVALSTFSTAVNGMPVTVREGEAWDADDPIVRQFPEAFSRDHRNLIVRRTRPLVEQATAAPGERRGR